MAAEQATATTGLARLQLGAQAVLRRSDVFFALGIVVIIMVLLVPIPKQILDFLLSVSITISVLILMTVLFIDKPLNLNSFPTILLIATMLRLALNIASTRLVLSHGHLGTDAAGYVIKAFGSLVMAGSVLIGGIIFAILTIINFVVITKGSGRIAEVSARFSLDAMPGKQMAIDADLSAGLIDEKVAKARRKELEDESSFYGAMDGASKFVRGDAIAGILITFINFVGGIIIGTVQKNLSFSQALETYTVLTVGDGLVSQIPALILSTAAGLLVTKSGVAGSAEKAVLGQLGRSPSAVAITSGILGFMALMPGIPAAPFLFLSSVTGYVAWKIMQTPPAASPDVLLPGQPAPPPGSPGAVGGVATADGKPAEEPISEALHIDVLRLELGYGLLPLINYQKGHRLTEQIKALRKQMVRDLGFIIPPVRIQDNMQLPANVYVIRVKEVESGRGEIKPDMLLVMNPSGGKIELPGEQTTEPTFGLPAMWVPEAYREEALFKNYTVVDPPTVVTTHLTELVKENMPEMLSYVETQKLVDELPKVQQKLISEVIPSLITISGVQRVLQSLLGEQISIRDLPTIIEAIAEGARASQGVNAITEHVRTRLARQISHANTLEAGYIPVATLSPLWEQSFAEALSGQGEERMLSMAPSKVQEFIMAMRRRYDQFAMQGEMPVLLTSPIIRPYVRSIVERFRPATVVLSQNEIHPRSKIKTLGQV